MAEQIILYLEISITENNLKKLLNSKFKEDPYKKKIGYYFSQLLYEGVNEPATLFILNFDKKNSTCFMAYAPRKFKDSMIASFVEIFKIISKLKNQNTTDYAIFATSFPTFIEGYIIKDSSVIKISSKEEPKKTVSKLSLKLWSFAKNNNFPNPKEALLKRNYLYKNFKNYYKRYLVYIEECEKPNKIAQATKESPYHLFDEFYAYDNKVFEISSYGKVEIPKADPLTFRCITTTGSSLYADKNVAFEEINVFEESIINKKSYFKRIRKYYKIIDGIDGSTFNYVKDRSETVFWKDKKHVFIYSKKSKQLIRIHNADVKTFEYIGFRFGKDKNNIYYLDQIIDINNKNYTLNKNGFIYDDKNVYHYKNNLNLDAKTFQVLQYESAQNPFIGTFILEDKNGKYEYNSEWEKLIIKK